MVIVIQKKVQPTSLKPVYMATTMEIDLAFGYSDFKVHLVIVVVGTIQLSSVFVALSMNVEFTPVVIPRVLLLRIATSLCFELTHYSNMRRPG